MNTTALVVAGGLAVGAVIWAVSRKKGAAPAGGLGSLLGGSDAASGLFGLDKARAAAGKDTVESDLRRARTQAGIKGALGAGEAILGAWTAA